MIKKAALVFLLAAFLWGFHLTQIMLAKINFSRGFSEGFGAAMQLCRPNTGLTLPEGAERIIDIEDPSYRHRNGP